LYASNSLSAIPGDYQKGYFNMRKPAFYIKLFNKDVRAKSIPLARAKLQIDKTSAKFRTP
jgi:hypothetical protein